MGKGRVEAAVDGTREVWPAILASTLTNVAVFLPIIFIEEEAGQLFRDMSVALTISFGLYLFVAPTVVPMLATLFLRKIPGSMRQGDGPPNTVMGKLLAPLGRAAAAVSERFYQVILWLTGGWARRLAVVSVLVVASAVGSYLLAPPLDYLPSGNQNLLFGILAPPPGYGTAEFKRMGEVVEDELRPWWEAAPRPGDSEEVLAQKRKDLAQLQQQWRAGVDKFALPKMRADLEQQRAMLASQGLGDEQVEAATATDAQRIRALETSPPPAAIENFFFVNRGGLVFMGGRSADSENVQPLSFLMTGAVRDIPGTFGFFRQAPIFRVARNGSGIELSVTGFDNDAVRAAAAATAGRLMEAFNTFPQSDPQNFSIGRSEVRVEPDRVRAAAAGVTSATIRDVAQVAVDGLIIGDYREQGRAIDLTVVDGTPRDDRYREDLRDVPITTRSGGVVPLSSVASFVDTSAPQQVNRTEEQPSVTFTVELPTGMTIQEAEGIVEERVVGPLTEAGVLGGASGVSVSLEGSADKLNSFLRAFLPGFALAAVITYLLLASLYESFLYPLVIVMSVPFALVGGFAALAALHWYEPSSVLDVLTMLGFVILVGTIVNNPILIVYQALNNVAAGMPRGEAIARSTQTRVRPIFMSVVTTVAGLAPLVVLGGAGSELYRGLGAVLVGGLVISTIFTLFLTPTLMSLLMDARDAVVGVFTRKPADAGDSPPPTARPPRKVSPDGESNGDGRAPAFAVPATARVEA